jgi:HPt (histidine-containing phosphotransfer) domain-containing protein
MDDLVARFLPQFVALARTRMAAVNSWMTRRDSAEKRTTLRELHSLKGDAGMLELTEVSLLAKDCEKQVERLSAESTEADLEPVLAALGHLARVIEGLGAELLAKAGPP